MLDDTAIRKIEDLVHEADPIQKAPDFHETGRFYLRNADGWSQEFAPLIARSASLEDTDSLARLITGEDDAGHEVEVFYSADRITALVHSDELQWRHAIPLRRHPAFMRLQQLVKTQGFTQKYLIRLLRAEFNGHVDDAVIQRFRTLKLTTEGGGQSVVAQGRAAVDKSIQRQVQDERGQEIPTEIEVTVPVYDLDEVRDDLQDVTVLVECTPDDDGRAQFELTAVINDLAEAQRDVLQTIVDALNAGLPDSVPTYYGSV